MDHFAGLDVSVKETSICIVDDTGRIVKEAKVASEPAALLKVLILLSQKAAGVGPENQIIEGIQILAHGGPDESQKQ
jgi:predicted NBD/HSP70 family sugar kinase